MGLPPHSGAELELHSRPGGSASGFTTVRDLGPNRGRSARRSPAPPTPVITGEPLRPCTPSVTCRHQQRRLLTAFAPVPPAAVASGEAAERVFRTHSADVPGTGSWAPSAQAAATSPDSSSPAAPAALPPRGQRGRGASEAEPRPAQTGPDRLMETASASVPREPGTRRLSHLQISVHTDRRAARIHVCELCRPASALRWRQRRFSRPLPSSCSCALPRWPTG